MKTVAEKLRIKPDTTLWLSHPARVGLIGPLPQSVSIVDGPEKATAALIFADDAASVRDILTANTGYLIHADLFWVAYPKGNKADINRDSLWPILGEFGMRPIGQVAVDEVWSALRFRPLKDGEAQFTTKRR
jgi:hypothetical protein